MGAQGRKNIASLAPSSAAEEPLPGHPAAAESRASLGVKVLLGQAVIWNSGGPPSWGAGTQCSMPLDAFLQLGGHFSWPAGAPSPLPAAGLGRSTTGHPAPPSPDGRFRCWDGCSAAAARVSPNGGSLGGRRVAGALKSGAAGRAEQPRSSSLLGSRANELADGRAAEPRLPLPPAFLPPGPPRPSKTAREHSGLPPQQRLEGLRDSTPLRGFSGFCGEGGGAGSPGEQEERKMAAREIGRRAPNGQMPGRARAP